MEFHSPWALLLLIFLPLIWYVQNRRSPQARIRFSNVQKLDKCPVSMRLRLRSILPFIRLLCIAALIVALARPRKGTEIQNISTDGVAMEILVDRSSSMGERMNFEGRVLNRLQVVKLVCSEFIKGNDNDLRGRSNDLLGLITFARYADTKCPLVQGHSIILDFLRETQLARPRSSEDGTAIGDAIQLACARLQKAEQQILENNMKMRQDSRDEDNPGQTDFTIKSKVIVLLTDGQDTVEESDPFEASQLAKEWGIKIYTIGIGDIQQGLFSRSTLDEPLLRHIAQTTGGFYGRAADVQTLRQIYAKIDELERSEIKSVQYTDYAERFESWALAGLILLTIEIFTGCTVFRKIP